MNLLIVKLSAIGDVVQALGFLNAMRRSFPDARITWLVEEAAADVLRDHPFLDRVIVSRRKSWVRALKQGRAMEAVRGFRSFRRELRAESYDVVVDLQGLFKSAILTFLSGGRRRVGFDRTRELSYLFVNERMPAYDPDRHALLRYLDAAEYLGAKVTSPPDFGLPVHEPSACSAAELLAGTSAPRVIVNTGAKWETKLWPVGHWRALCEQLAAESGIQLIMTGGPDDAAVNREIAEGLKGVLDLTGRTSLKVLAEVYRLSDLVITPDTGPMHLAAAVGAPVVALFGPTAPWRTGPFGPGHVVLRTGADCSPCFRKECPDPHCMTGLTAESVFRAVLDKLEGTNN